MKFLLIEDNADLARSVAARLSLDGHPVDLAGSLAAAEDHLAVATYDMVLLDITLPDGDGGDFLRSHRAASRDTPVIVMTARSEVSERIAMLDKGADDYLTKPFDFNELGARARAVLRRRYGASRTERSFADLVFDPLTATVRLGNDTRELRNRELRLLEIFFSAPDRIYSKDQLCDRLFSAADSVSDNAIEVYVGRLRRKLAGSKARIETVRGVGYRLTAQ